MTYKPTAGWDAIHEEGTAAPTADRRTLPLFPDRPGGAHHPAHRSRSPPARCVTELINAGLARARSEGKRLGRPPAGMPADTIALARAEMDGWPFAGAGRRPEALRPGLAEIARRLAARGHLEPARTTGRHRHPARPWPIHTIQRAIRRALKAGS